MDIDFSTQKLEIKSEYLDKDIIYIKHGNVIKLTLNPKSTLPEDYYFYYKNGFEDIFEVINI